MAISASPSAMAATAAVAEGRTPLAARRRWQALGRGRRTWRRGGGVRAAGIRPAALGAALPPLARARPHCGSAADRDRGRVSRPGGAVVRGGSGRCRSSSASTAGPVHEYGVRGDGNYDYSRGETSCARR